MIQKLKTLAVATAVALSATGAVPKEALQQTVVNGKEYYYYDVQPGETIFSLSQRLGIPREEIEAANPSVADGLKAYTRLYFPVESGVDAIAPATVNGTVVHEVKKGETLYGISKKYNVTVDRIIALNPSARDGVKAGDRLNISDGETAASVPQASVATDGMSNYIIGQGETLYRIASDNGITVEALLAANPGLDAFNYSAGMEIRIPRSASLAPGERRIGERSIVKEDDREDEEVPMASASTTSSENARPRVSTPLVTDDRKPSATNNHQSQTAAVVEDTKIPIVHDSISQALEQVDEFNVAVMLPFMLSEETPSRSAELFTDFYRGFVLAADTLSHSGTKVKIYAYDTANSPDTVAALMNRPEMKTMNVIVGPDTDDQFNIVVDATDPETTFVVNSFAVKNETYKDHENVIQTNIPHSMMYGKAIEAFLQSYTDREPVFLARIDGAADKDEFTTELKTRLTDRDIAYREILFRDALSDDDLSQLSADSAYVFVPVSGTRAEFIKIVPALKRYNETMGGAEGIAVFGYPEWIAFRGDMLDNLGAVNATIYSRFYNDQSYYPARRVAENFRRWYGREMIDAVPSQGMLGYDTGNYVIKALRSNNGDFHLKDFDYDGLQSDFTMDDSDVDGLVNTSLLLIRFRPDGLVDKRKI